MDALTKELRQIELENLENEVITDKDKEKLRQADKELENDEINLEIKAEYGQDLKN